MFVLFCVCARATLHTLSSFTYAFNKRSLIIREFNLKVNGFFDFLRADIGPGSFSGGGGGGGPNPNAARTRMTFPPSHILFLIFSPFSVFSSFSSSFPLFSSSLVLYDL